LYPSFAKHSRNFSQKLLIDKIHDNKEDGIHQTFVLVLTDTLTKEVSQSINVYDYYGLTMVVGYLLASLSTHYGHYSDNCIIDMAFEKLFPRFSCVDAITQFLWSI
jgi:hypothetical protein